MKQLPVLLTLTGLAFVSCERHEWHSDEDQEPKSTDTINLFLHDDHSGEHGADHSGDHKGSDEGQQSAKEDGEKTADH
jgi:hypothetical protein